MHVFTSPKQHPSAQHPSMDAAHMMSPFRLVPKARMLFWHGLLLKAWLLNIALPHENPEASLVVGFRATELCMSGYVVAPYSDFGIPF